MSRLIILFALPILTVTGWYIFRLVREVQTIRAMARSGITTQAHIIQKRKKLRGRSPYYYVTFSFVAPNVGTFHVEQQVNSANYLYGLREGSSVSVVYLPGKPHTARLAGAHRDNTGRREVFLYGVIGVVFVVALLIVFARS